MRRRMVGRRHPGSAAAVPPATTARAEIGVGRQTRHGRAKVTATSAALQHATYGLAGPERVGASRPAPPATGLAASTSTGGDAATGARLCLVR